MDIADVRKAFVENKFRYTKHGTEQRINRHITGEDIKQAILPIISIVTVYEPDPGQWIDNRIRRK